jgi:hypothetical protein
MRVWYSDCITGLTNGNRGSNFSRDKTYCYAPKSAQQLSGPTSILFNRDRGASGQSSHVLLRLRNTGVVHPLNPFVFMG